jgi:hypothetical protein
MFGSQTIARRASTTPSIPLSVSDLHSFMNSDHVEVRKSPGGGLPDFFSPYLSLGNTVGNVILNSLRISETRRVLSHDVLWGSRSHFPVCA